MTMNKSGRGGSRESFTIPIRVYGVAQPGADTAALRALVRELQEKLDDACRRGLFCVTRRKKGAKKKRLKKESPGV